MKAIRVEAFGGESRRFSRSRTLLIRSPRPTKSSSAFTPPASTPSIPTSAPGNTAASPPCRTHPVVTVQAGWKPSVQALQISLSEIAFTSAAPAPARTRSYAFANARKSIHYRHPFPSSKVQHSGCLMRPLITRCFSAAARSLGRRSSFTAARAVSVWRRFNSRAPRGSPSSRPAVQNQEETCSPVKECTPLSITSPPATWTPSGRGRMAVVSTSFSRCWRTSTLPMI